MWKGFRGNKMSRMEPSSVFKFRKFAKFYFFNVGKEYIAPTPVPIMVNEGESAQKVCNNK